LRVGLVDLVVVWFLPHPARRAKRKHVKAGMTARDCDIGRKLSDSPTVR
jgi:hypothetical protein